jgi:hypothetical protein
MKYYIVFENGKVQKTITDYKIGDMINVNSYREMICKSKKLNDGKMYLYFEENFTN